MVKIFELMDALKRYLEGLGYNKIYCDTMSIEPDECIGLFLYSNPPSQAPLNVSTRYFRIQVRRHGGANAKKDAQEIYNALCDDTKPRVIMLDGYGFKVLAMSGPLKQSVSGNDLTTYYFQVSMFGKNDE